MGTNAISAAVIAVSVAVGAGGDAGVGASIGISLARNAIGASIFGDSDPTEIQAYILRSSVTAQNGGTLTLTSTSSHTIGAIVLAGSVAVGASGGARRRGHTARASPSRT